VRSIILKYPQRLPCAYFQSAVIEAMRLHFEIKYIGMVGVVCLALLDGQWR